MAPELQKQYSAVWVVTGEKYVPWGLASAATFHVLHPDCNLVWLVSDSAATRTENLIPDFLKNRLEMRVVAQTGESDKEASRRLKVQARRLVKGDFFQVDADILFVRPLDFDWSSVSTMAAAPNRETIGEFKEDPTNSWAAGIFLGVGWEMPEHYFNTGFIFWRDAIDAHEFASQWERERGEFLLRTRHCIDQPAFNKVAGDMGCVTLLNSRFNAPVITLPQLSKGASCYHYYASLGEETGINCTMLARLASKIERKEKDVLEEFNKFQSNPKPFVGWGATEQQYWLAGQWRDYAERKLRVGWDQWKKKAFGR
jgi:hypothetical protein